MYVDTSIIKRGDKTYTRHLLRTSFREGRRVRHKTLFNLSGHCSKEEVNAIRLALRHKGKCAEVTSLREVETRQGKRVGAAWSLVEVAKRVGLRQALGSDRSGQLATLQVIARVIDQGSRLSAVRLGESHTLCEVLGLKTLTEDDLYENLAWLAAHQESIEKALFAARYRHATPTLFLYDVTSSYLEGRCNALGQYGYDRDGKRGKQQIVVGLLAGPDGQPIAVRVFEGNTPDTKTVSEQVRILAESFGVKEVTLVGDRGMLKGPQLAALPDDFRYITALTKPQIVKLLGEGTLQMELFGEEVCEVEMGGIRHVLRRNPLRATEMAHSRASKQTVMETLAATETSYLAEHPRANAAKALNRVTAKLKRLKAEKWLTASEHERTITLTRDEAALAQAALLDGCYVITSDVPKRCADAQTLHDRYCDLERIERAFRTMKTAHLDLRPVYVHKKVSTQGHVLVVMLALLLQRELERCWADLDLTVEEGIDELGALRTIELRLGSVTLHDIPQPDARTAELLEKASITLPTTLPLPSAHVHTKKKLNSERNRS